MSEPAPRRTQADRRATTRKALMTSAARGLSTYGYANLVLEQVATEAGYTRGALYHLFPNKEELVLAVAEWVAETWREEVRVPARAQQDPLSSLLTLARGHALFCRRGLTEQYNPAQAMQTLGVEFAGQDHPIAHALDAKVDELVAEVSKLIRAARRNGSIPAGPPAVVSAQAFFAVLESVAIYVAGKAPHDVELVERAVRGILGVSIAPNSEKA